jgi:hypothetical protein
VLRKDGKIRMWIVKLIKMPTINDFRDGFFARELYYKSDAIALQDEVKRKGGEAKIIRKGEEGVTLFELVFGIASLCALFVSLFLFYEVIKMAHHFIVKYW